MFGSAATLAVVNAARDRQPDDWDDIDRLTRRVLRWILVGVPTWFVFLALLDEEWTGIPLLAGFAMSCVLTLMIVAAVDIWRGGRRQGRGLSAVGRGLFVWAVTFTAFALLVAIGGRTGAAVVLVPVVGATVVTAFVEFARRVLAAGRRA